MSYIKIYKEEAVLLAEALKQVGASIPAHITDEINTFAAVPSFEIIDQYGDKAIEVFATSGTDSNGDTEELIGVSISKQGEDALATIYLNRQDITELVCGTVDLIYKNDVERPAFPYSELSPAMQKMLKAIQDAAAKSLKDEKNSNVRTSRVFTVPKPSTGKTYTSVIPSDHHAALKVLSIALEAGVGICPENAKYRSIISIVTSAIECNRIDDVYNTLAKAYPGYDLTGFASTQAGYAG